MVVVVVEKRPVAVFGPSLGSPAAFGDDAGTPGNAFGEEQLLERTPGHKSLQQPTGGAAQRGGRHR
eukprot:2081743-Pyramimonas_sp.AAC.1